MSWISKKATISNSVHDFLKPYWAEVISVKSVTLNLPTWFVCHTDTHSCIPLSIAHLVSSRWVGLQLSLSQTSIAHALGRLGKDGLECGHIGKQIIFWTACKVVQVNLFLSNHTMHEEMHSSPALIHAQAGPFWFSCRLWEAGLKQFPGRQKAGFKGDHSH